MLPSATPHSIPESHHMIPGQTYVGILPGHTRPVFVRKRPVDIGRPPLFLTQVFGSSRRAYSVEAPGKPSMFRRSRSGLYYDYATAKYRPKYYVDHAPGRTITSTQQTCASCGRFRSARWQSRHPLIPGSASRPGLCGRCRHKHTSSEEERPRYHRRRRHHRHRDYTESTDDSYSTSWESRRAARRHRSYSRDCRRRSLARSPSKENVRIVIANQAGDRIRAGRETTRSSSVEPVRVIDPQRTRSILRSSSHAEYEDSAARYIENIDPPRYLPRARAVSRVSYIEDLEHHRYRSRPRGSSHVSYVEEFERPRYCSRPRSVSRVSYIEDLDPLRSRCRARSSSQVRFVDEIDEPVCFSRPRSLKRRRVVYCDGAADVENSERLTDSRMPSNRRLSQGAASGDDVAVLVEERLSPSFRASPKPVEKQFILHHRPTSRCVKDSDSIPETVSDHHYDRQPSKTSPPANGSDHDATPRPAFRHTQAIQNPDDFEEPPSHHSSYIDFEGARSYRRSYSPALESRESSRQRIFHGPEIPYGERRERVRESDESSDPDDDDYPRRSPIRYRHVEAPEAPTPDSDLLAEMLQNASITPPSAQYTRGRPSQRVHCSEMDTPSQSCPRKCYPSEDSEDGDRRYGVRRTTGEMWHGGPSLREPKSKSNAEYDWMT